MEALALTRGDWSARIRATWVSVVVDAFLSVGRDLLAAKEALPHGEFEAMVEAELPFRARTAQMLMRVASNEVLANPKHVSLLPPSWGTLYELTKVPPPLLEESLHDGRVTPAMERADALRLRADVERRTPKAHPADETCTADDLRHLIGRRFATIYADPPWPYENRATRGATTPQQKRRPFHYSTMTVEEIAALPVPEIAAPDAHLHLWATNAFLREAFAIVDAWGFEYKSCFVWVKPQMGMGNYWRVSHEFLLLGTRGDTSQGGPAEFRSRSEMSWLKARREGHSAKPEAISQLIEKVSPGPYLEMFGRRVRKGWTVWGNEIKRRVFDEVVELPA